ncbi:MAG: hypothetical protein KJ052_01720 [Candidatus Hydrogenedentes bacterium]|nr:hypothetical protein [Candidatus Hydrogenedentota bacterium]
MADLPGHRYLALYGRWLPGKAFAAPPKAAWEAVNLSQVRYEKDEAWLTGEKLRTDTTACEANIQYPTWTGLAFRTPGSREWPRQLALQRNVLIPGRPWSISRVDKSLKKPALRGLCPIRGLENRETA